MSDLLDDLAAVVGAAHVLTEPDMRCAYERDFTGRFAGSARAVIRPVDTAQVAKAVAICAAHRVAVVAQGGNTAGILNPGVVLQVDD